ncbi:MAG: mechanosensitive ion channel family protein [Acidimicrobiia bacterium]
MLLQTVPGIDEIVDVDSVTGWDVVTAIVIVVVAVGTAAVVRHYTKKRLTSVKGIPDAVRATIARMTGYAIVLVGILLAMPYLGFDTQPVMILLLVIGLLVFFGGRPLMEDFTAGIILQARKPFGVGDLIRHVDHLGVVSEIDGRATVLVTPDGVTVRIANSVILREPIVNLSREGARRSTVDVGVAYGTDLDQTVAVLREAVNGLDNVLADPPALIGVASYEESAILLQVSYWHAPMATDEIVARDEVMRSISQALAQAGIVIAFPQRDVWLRTTRDDPQNEERSR